MAADAEKTERAKVRIAWDNMACAVVAHPKLVLSHLFLSGLSLVQGVDIAYESRSAFSRRSVGRIGLEGKG